MKKLDAKKMYMSFVRQDMGLLLELIADYGLDGKDKDGRSLLINAAAEGQIKILQYLIDSGADVNLQDEEGFTALHLAAIQDHIGIVKLLLDSHCQIDVQDNCGNSALWRAEMTGNSEIAELLLKRGANGALKNHSDVSYQDLLS